MGKTPTNATYSHASQAESRKILWEAWQVVCSHQPASLVRLPGVGSQVGGRISQVEEVGVNGKPGRVGFPTLSTIAGSDSLKSATHVATHTIFSDATTNSHCSFLERRARRHAVLSSSALEEAWGQICCEVDVVV